MTVSFNQSDCETLDKYPSNTNFRNVAQVDNSHFREIRTKLKTLAEEGVSAYSGSVVMKDFVSILSPSGRAPNILWNCIHPEFIPNSKEKLNKSFGLQVALVIRSDGAELTFCFGSGTSQS